MADVELLTSPDVQTWRASLDADPFAAMQLRHDLAARGARDGVDVHGRDVPRRWSAGARSSSSAVLASMPTARVLRVTVPAESERVVATS